MLVPKTWIFVLELLRNPAAVGSIVPSSRSLAALIAREVTEAAEPVIELGAGTGVIARQLIGQGVSPGSLTLIEKGRSFAGVLKERFPSSLICCIDACNLEEVEEFTLRKAGAVISGLPMAMMSSNKIRSVMKAAFRQLRPRGAFYQFTYLPRCPVSALILKDIGLRSVYLGGTFLNLPPAFVYRIERLSAFE